MIGAPGSVIVLANLLKTTGSVGTGIFCNRTRHSESETHKRQGRARAGEETQPTAHRRADARRTCSVQ